MEFQDKVQKQSGGSKDREHLREAETTAAESPLVTLGLGAWTLRPWRDLTF